jgi:hypothetical protein
MEELPRIWVDWNDYCDNCDKGTVWLGLDFTRKHFEKQGIPLREGLKIRLFGDDVEADAVVVRVKGGWEWGAEIVEGTLINVDISDENSN